MKKINHNGFTLVEITVSLLIASIGMMIATTLILNSMGYFDKTVATDLDKQALDGVKDYVQNELIYASSVVISDEYPSDKTSSSYGKWHWLYVKDGELYRDNNYDVEAKSIPVYNTDFLYKKYEKRVILLVDEYDTPFMSAYAGKYSEQVKDLLTGMFSSALKDNEYLYKGVLTGIQRIAKENLFSGLNNLEVCSIQDEKYKDVFGFTEDETRTLLEAHHLELNQDVKEMYDGYTIGGTEIYNPWSVINYADKGVLASYWINTGSNEVVCQLLEKSSNKVKKQYIELLEKGEMKVNCILEGAYIELRGATQLWALLVHAGYLTIKEKITYHQYVLRIVNGEVKQDLIYIMMRIYAWDEVDVAGMFQLIQEGKMKEFEEAYQEILFNYPSYFDLKDENSYHVLLLGLCIIVSDSYEIMSNQEKGYGRADIYLKSKKGQRDIVIEMKYAENDKEDCLLASADKAMTQILDKHYGDDAIKIGIGNHQKKAKMAWKI